MSSKFGLKMLIVGHYGRLVEVKFNPEQMTPIGKKFTTKTRFLVL